MNNEEHPLTRVIEGVLGEFKLEGAMPAEESEEVAQEGTEEEPEPFSKEVPVSGDHE